MKKLKDEVTFVTGGTNGIGLSIIGAFAQAGAMVAVSDDDDMAELAEADHRQHPSGRVGFPADIARLCLFLAPPENDFKNGQNITAGGGMTKKMIIYK